MHKCVRKRKCTYSPLPSRFTLVFRKDIIRNEIGTRAPKEQLKNRSDTLRKKIMTTKVTALFFWRFLSRADQEILQQSNRST